MTSGPSKNGNKGSDKSLAGIDAMIRACQMPGPWRLMNEEGWVQFWRNQDVILTCMEEFADGWFRRRHTATATALDTALRCCEAKTPFDVSREMLTWSMGSMQRVMQDGLACQKYCLELARLTPHLAPEEEAAQEPEQGSGVKPPAQPKTAAKTADKAA